MATFTSVTSGNWNDGATWGLTSPGVKGTDWPGNAGDVVNIGTTGTQSHVVTYNVSEANALGAVTVGAASGAGRSVLYASRGASTKMVLGATVLKIDVTGRLDYGTVADPIPAARVAEIYFTPSSDAGTGLDADQTGAQVWVYGDAAYYGSDFDTTLYGDHTFTVGAGRTLQVNGDFTAKWAVGQYLYLHKFTTYSSNTGDFAIVKIASIVGYSAPYTEFTVDITATGMPTVGGAAAWKSGGYVLNTSRNVIIGKYQAAPDPGPAALTNRPYIYTPNPLDSLISECLTWGVMRLFGGGSVYGINVSILQCGQLGYAGSNNISLTGTIFSCSGTLVGGADSSISGYFGGTGNYLMACPYDNFVVTGEIYGQAVVIGGSQGKLVDCNIFSCNSVVGSTGASSYSAASLYNCKLGYNAVGTNIDNVYDVMWANTQMFDCLAVNCMDPASWVKANRNTAGRLGRLRLLHKNQVLNAYSEYVGFGDIDKVAADGTGDNPSQRSGGSADVLEVDAQINCGVYYPVEILRQKVWVTSGTATTVRYYIQTDYVTGGGLSSAELSLTGTYLNGSAGDTSAMTPSTQSVATRADADDWSQYVEVTFTPGATGFAEVVLTLMADEAGKYVWVDPMPVVAGKTFEIKWEEGGAQVYEQAGSGGGLLTHPGMGGGLNG